LLDCRQMKGWHACCLLRPPLRCGCNVASCDASSYCCMFTHRFRCHVVHLCTGHAAIRGFVSAAVCCRRSLMQQHATWASLESIHKPHAFSL
jgi:hypothetical protein